MDKKAIKEFAVNARKELIEEVTTKLNRLGITDKGIEEAKRIDQSLQEIESTQLRLTGNAITQRDRLIEKLKQKSSTSDYKEEYQSLIEEVAYTWFNRLIAIRFMEVNDYLPDSYRVLSSENTGKIEPDIITDIYDSDIYEELSTSEKQQVNEWKMDNSAEAMDKLYQFVFIKICHQLNDYLPELFEQVEDDTELLFTASYIKKDGVIAKLLSIPEENFDVSQGGQVEIIGWLYQYYNSEPKELVFSRPKSQKIKKQDIPAATQLFTPDWIVRYMVENSLGRFYIEKMMGNGDTRTEKEIAQHFNWVYYLETAEQPDVVMIELKEDQKEKAHYHLEEIKFIDPSMGSGHVLVYAFDVFMQLYEHEGYSKRDAATLILENNLFGLDIDHRAQQLAYFALMMKGREQNRQLFKKQIKLNCFDVPESKELQKDHDFLNEIKEFLDDEEVCDELDNLIKYYTHGKDYGSLIKIKEDYHFDDIVIGLQRFKESQKAGLFLDDTIQKVDKIFDIITISKILSSKYDIVVTNPPYMGSSGMDKTLSDFAKKEYPQSKSDLFAMFIEQCEYLLGKHGYCSMITQQAWMFLSSFEKLRNYLVNNSTIINMANLGSRAFEEIGGEVVQTTTFVIRKNHLLNYNGTYVRLVDYKSQEAKKNAYLNASNDDLSDIVFKMSQNNFQKIPGMPIAYWASDALIKDFEIGTPISEYTEPKVGLQTGDNNRFLRLWWEVDFNKIKFDATSLEDARLSRKKWFPYNKGGSFRRWYGNYDYIVNWENDGEEIRNFCDSKGKVRSRPQNTNYYFKESITWPLITSGGLSVRYREYGSIHDVSGMSAFSNKTENIFYCLGILNSPIGNNILKLLNPTINSQVGDFEKIPIIYDDKVKSLTIDKVKKCINLSKLDWDSEEISWDFKRINLRGNKILDYIVNESHLKNTHIEELRKNHESINHNFLTLYDLDNDYSSVVEDKDIPITKLNKLETIKNFISYSIGVMFGRYSLDEEGLIFAGGQWDDSRYTSFKPDKDNVLLITDDEYFKDSQIDIVNRFIEFVKVTFGSDTLEENLQFIADTLGGKGKSREVIRRYFVKDFYKDHLKTYSNRPIYWQLDSGKQNGFKALMYLHRYTPDQLGKVRTEYLHELQKAYDNRIEWREQQIAASDNQKDINKWSKDMTKIQKQLKELRDYDEKLGHLALNRIELDLDDGVIVNYDKLQRDTDTGEKFKILSKGVKEPKK